MFVNIVNRVRAFRSFRSHHLDQKLENVCYFIFGFKKPGNTFRSYSRYKTIKTVYLTW